MRKIYQVIFTLIISLWMVQAAVAAELKIAVGLALPPYIIEGSNTGIEVDIVQQALLESGNTIKLVYLPFVRVPVSLTDGTADAALTINESSGIKNIFYSDSHISYQNVAVSLKSKNLKIGSVADLSKVSVVAFQNATKYLGSGFADMAKGNSKYSELGIQDSQVKMLFAGRADVVVMDINIFKYFRQKVNSKDADVNQEIVIHEIFAPTAYKVGFKDKALCEKFNAGLKKLKSSGKYGTIWKKYIK